MIILFGCPDDIFGCPDEIFGCPDEIQSPADWQTYWSCGVLQDVFYRFKAILYTFQPFHQSSQFGVGIISVTLHFLFHRPIGIGHSFFKTATIVLKVIV